MSFPLISFMVQYKNNGEDGIMVLTSLPLLVGQRFQQELKKMTEGPNSFETIQPVNIISML